MYTIAVHCCVQFAFFFLLKKHHKDIQRCIFFHILRWKCTVNGVSSTYHFNSIIGHEWKITTAKILDHDVLQHMVLFNQKIFILRGKQNALFLVIGSSRIICLQFCGFVLGLPKMYGFQRKIKGNFQKN